jgi:trimethylamine--corrinoid protein Co-methyltransferase
MLSPHDAERIHTAAVALLDRPGIKIEHERIVKLLLDNGATSGNDADVIRLPRQLIDECIARCPKQFALADRRGGEAVMTAESKPLFWSCPGMNMHTGGTQRPFTRGDMAATARLLDKLEHVHGVFGLAMHDVPPKACDVVGLQTMAANTHKHIRVLCFSPQGADMLKQLKPLAPGAWFSIGFTAHGPLRWTNLALDIFARTAGAGIPVSINGEPMAGATGPVTLAGAAAVGNAEILAGIVINQLLEPGRPCTYNLGLAHTFDMRAAIAVTGGPENHILADISAAMGRYYNLPSASWVSTEAMLPDAQAATEKAAGFVWHMQARVSNIWGVGQLESELTFSPAQAVIDNEMIAYVDRLLRPIDVSDEALAIDVTREVGAGGQFLDHDHTVMHYRDELFSPALLFRGTRETWTQAGSLSLSERAQRRAVELIDQPIDCGLDADQLRELDRAADAIIKSA